MSQIHIVEGDQNNTYQMVVHAPTPQGSNAAGVTWPDAIRFSGRNVSVLTPGNNPGQITQNELTQVEAGNVIEGNFSWTDNPAWTPAERKANIDAYAQSLMNDLVARWSAELKYFGYKSTN